MLAKKTTFVVGAGAGFDINMPLGVDLKEIIAKQLNIKVRYSGSTLESGDHAIYQAIKTHMAKGDENEFSYEDIDRAIGSIRRSFRQATSIDNYLDNHSSDSATVFLGKLGIVNSIAKAERSSKLHYDVTSSDSTIDANKIEGTWYYHLLQKICDKNNNIEQLEDTLKNTTFIIFNYDRCLEHFLFESIKTYWRLDDETASSLLAKTRFLHPYGSLGELRWQNFNKKFAFGGNVSTEFLLNTFTKIKTFTEQIREATILDEIHDIIQNTHTLIFLGFAFHDQNIQLLSPTVNSSVEKMLGTGIGISEWDLEDVNRELLESLRPQNKLSIQNISPDLDCAGLFIKNWRIIGK